MNFRAVASGIVIRGCKTGEEWILTVIGKEKEAEIGITMNMILGKQIQN